MVARDVEVKPAEQPLVLVNDVPSRSIARQLDEFAQAWEAGWAPANPEAAFSRWATYTVGFKMPFTPETAEWNDLPDQRWFEAPILASAGYELALGQEEIASRWVAGIDRLRQRKALLPDRQSFFFRPFELLGIGLGARALRDGSASTVEWLGDLLSGGANLLGQDVRSRVAAALVRLTLKGDANWQPIGTPEIWQDLATLLWATAAFPTVPWLDKPPNQLEAQLLRHAMLDAPQVDDAATASLAWISLRLAATHILDASIGSLSASEITGKLVAMLRRFPLLVRQLQHRREQRTPLVVRDEYDVQDLLRAILSLHYDDVQPEEWAPSYGGAQSRMDLLLRPERTVVETKMTRSGLRQREIVEQLTIDRDHYKTHPGCDRLVCFVYDPDGRLTNPVALEHDLSSDAPLPTVVVVAPRGV